MWSIRTTGVPARTAHGVHAGREMPETAPRIWAVGSLCRAIADALDARFNPVAVRGEISGFSRASSGHCYFALKDESGQLRCAMFRRAAGLLDFAPRDGALVEVRGRLDVYGPRGDLQLVVESMQMAGAGSLFEQFLRLKAQLEGEGLFDAARKRPLATLPRGIGIVTSPGAAALRDVVTALARRAPHVPLLLAPAPVQGAGAAAELVRALQALYDQVAAGLPIDTILLVRGGGSIEDLWAFNDAALARTIARSPVPVVSGVGHESDFTIADFVADLRAPTPTAAAELAALAQDEGLAALRFLEGRLRDAVGRRLDREQQRLDHAVLRLGRPAARLQLHALGLQRMRERLGRAVQQDLRGRSAQVARAQGGLPVAVGLGLERGRRRLDHLALRLQALDPHAALGRGYAWLTDAAGLTVSDSAQVREGQRLHATLAHGALELDVTRALREATRAA